MIKNVTESYNYFGDTVLEYDGESYNLFQYNCRAAKDLLKKVRTDKAVVFVLTDNSWYGGPIVFTPLIPYLERIIQTNDEVNEIRKYSDNGIYTAGMEIAGRYGY